MTGKTEEDKQGSSTFTRRYPATQGQPLGGEFCTRAWHCIGGWGVSQPGNRFVSCVRCEAVCARETMMFLSLGLATVNSAPWACPWPALGFGV